MGKRAFLLMSIAWLAAPAARAQRVQDLVRVREVREIQLKGIGLVVGLANTGDDPKSWLLNAAAGEMIRKILGAAPRELKTRNVAVVMVTANLPSTTKVGSSFTVNVSSIGNAKDLTGGQLLETALMGPITPAEEEDEASAGEDPGRFRYYAVAQGPVSVPSSSSVKTSGAAPAILEEPLAAEFETNLESIVLILDRPSFPRASRIADAINRYPYFDLDPGEDPRIARAVDAGSVRVRIPNAYLKAGRIVDFLSQALSEVEVPEVGTEGRIVLNHRAKSVVINGEVRVSPVVIRWKGLSIRVPPANAAGPDKPLLIDVIRELESGGIREGIQGEDLIAIVRDMYRAGAIEGKLVEP